MLNLGKFNMKKGGGGGSELCISQCIFLSWNLVLAKLKKKIKTKF